MNTSPTKSNLEIYLPYSKPHMPDHFQINGGSNRQWPSAQYTPAHDRQVVWGTADALWSMMLHRFQFCLNRGTGYWRSVLVSLRTNMQLSVSAVTTASVPLTQPESISMFLRNTTRAPTLSTSVSGSLSL